MTEITEIGERQLVHNSASYLTLIKPPLTFWILNTNGGSHMTNNLDCFQNMWPIWCTIKIDNEDKVLAHAWRYVRVEKKLPLGRKSGLMIYDILYVLNLSENFVLITGCVHNVSFKYCIDRKKYLYWRKSWRKWRQDCCMVSIERKWFYSAAIGDFCKVGSLPRLELQIWIWSLHGSKNVGLVVVAVLPLFLIVL